MMSNLTPRLLWLRERIAWMGQHSGYEQLCDEVTKLWSGQHQSVQRESKSLPRLVRRFLDPIVIARRKSLTYDASSAVAELSTIWRSLYWRCSLVHVLYVERNLGFLPEWRQRLSFQLVGTVHQPAGLWRIKRHNPEIVSSLDQLIVLSSREVDYFEQYLPGRVHYIPHGIDTDFFCPLADTPNSVGDRSYPRCVFSGTWLRDIQTLVQVVDEVLARDQRIRFDMIVPMDKRYDPYFYRIARHSQVFWHAGISDQQLRDLYRQASLLILPLLDCTANNALLEAIACGLPIVSNDVGGLPDYTRDSFADLLPVGDVDGLVEAILRLVNDRQECSRRGVAARSFAEQNLAWNKISLQTLTVYKKALSICPNFHLGSRQGSI